MAAPWVLQMIYASLLSQSNYVPNKQTTGDRVFVTTSTSYGDLRGVRKLTATKILVDSYLGIPFALPPVEQRRFRRPEPPERWDGVRDASSFGKECMQRPFPGYAPYKVAEKPLEQSEDCLYLNVYVPADMKSDQALAVMVWVHGGGYYVGAGSQYDGTELAATGIIVVTINYRLDIFGFLSNEDDVIPGNYGMLDQIMALEWVRGNIHSFGGDPNRVTVYGESAGAGCVSLLVLSPLAKNLFQRAIMSTGVSLSPWTITTSATRLPPSTTLSLVGAFAGCRQSNITEKLHCFKKLDARVLFNASESVQSAFGSQMLFAPRVENTFSFLPDLPINILIKDKFNHVDTIHGFNTAGFGSGIVARENDLISKHAFEELFKMAINPYVLTNAESIVSEASYHYIGNETNRTAIRDAAVNAISDFQFTASTFLEANIHSTLAEEKNHYVYEFSYKPSFSSYPSWLKAVHGEDIPFVFGVNLQEFKISGKSPNEEDKFIWTKMKTFWSNFVKYGNPSHSLPCGAVMWENFGTDSMYLKIDKDEQMLAFHECKKLSIYKNILRSLQASYHANSSLVCGL